MKIGEPTEAHRTGRAIAMVVLLASCMVMFTGLGIWQLQRLAWKQDLITTVEARIHADPIPIPAPSEWDRLDVESLSYLRVRLTGTFDHAAEVQSLAVSELGSGYWVMTPLWLDGGGTVLVNRGFVPQALRDPATRLTTAPEGRVEVTGLLRPSEPEGGFLRDNDPVAGRWYSRDTGAIADAKNLPDPLAPFFVDVATVAMAESVTDGESNAAVDDEPGTNTRRDVSGSEYPRAGLTVINFRNTHLSYALTWFTLALLSVAGVAIVLRERKKDQNCIDGIRKM